MTPVVISLLLLGGFAYFAVRAWGLVDRQREGEAQDVAEELRAMGELVPTSLHPQIDPSLCMGSGACVHACPEHDVIGLVHGQVALLNPLACVGHGACADACPVSAIKLVFGTASRGVELPKVSRDYETKQAGLYVVGELGGMGLIKNAVSQGAAAAKSIGKGSRRGQTGGYDVIVVGAGPAGISATLGAMKAGLNVLLVDREELGGTILHYPRAKVAMTGALEFPLYGRVKRSRMSKEELVALWTDIHAKHPLPFRAGVLVEDVTTRGSELVVRAGSEELRAANVVLALGRRGSPRKLGVPGEELEKVVYRVIEPIVFQGRDVLVVGGGNAAVETVFALLDQGQCRSVSVSYRRDVFARCRRSNRERIERELAAGTVRSLLGTQVTCITESTVELEGADGALSLPNDSVVVQAGGTPPTGLLKSAGIELVTLAGEAL